MIFKEEKEDFENFYLGIFSKDEQNSRADYQKHFLHENKAKISRQIYRFKRGNSFSFFFFFLFLYLVVCDGSIDLDIAEVPTILQKNL